MQLHVDVLLIGVGVDTIVIVFFVFFSWADPWNIWIMSQFPCDGQHAPVLYRRNKEFLEQLVGGAASTQTLNTDLPQCPAWINNSCGHGPRDSSISQIICALPRHHYWHPAILTINSTHSLGHHSELREPCVCLLKGPMGESHHEFTFNTFSCTFLRLAGVGLQEGKLFLKSLLLP